MTARLGHPSFLGVLRWSLLCGSRDSSVFILELVGTIQVANWAMSRSKNPNYGLGMKRAFAASSNAKIFWAGLSIGQPKMHAWFKFSGSGLGSTDNFSFRTSSARMSALPCKVAGRLFATSCPFRHISDSESDLMRVTDKSGYGYGMKASCLTV